MVILDPELMPLLAGAPQFEPSVAALDAVRSQSAQALTELVLSDKVERSVHVVRSEPELVVRVHRPSGRSGTLPCIYAAHGGGYILGSAAMDDARFDRWCAAFDCVGVSVEYRLAPETPYPGPLDDCYAGLRWVWQHADELGVDRARIGVSGVSAGGGLAAALALLARDRGEVPLSFQLLECPMIDDRRVTPSSRLDGLPVWSREANEFGWRSYLGELFGTDDVPPYAAPARAADLSRLPPALVIVGGADGFRDEDTDYAARLNQAGVPTELHVLPGAPHGVQLFAGTGIALRWTTLVDDWLCRALQSDR